MKPDFRHVLYLSRRYFDDPDGNQQCVFIFDKAWRTRQALTAILRDDEIVWDGDDCLTSSSGIVVRVHRCSPGLGSQDTLRQMFDYEPTLKEMAKTLEFYRVRECRIFREGRAPKSLDDDPAVQAKRERRAKTPTVDHPAGAVHVSDVALSMGIDPRQARAALRGIMEKPAWGWWFRPDEVEDVRRKIREAVK